MEGSPHLQEAPWCRHTYVACLFFSQSRLSQWGEKPSNTLSATSDVTAPEMFGNWAPRCHLRGDLGLLAQEPTERDATSTRPRVRKRNQRNKTRDRSLYFPEGTAAPG